MPLVPFFYALSVFGTNRARRPLNLLYGENDAIEVQLIDEYLQGIRMPGYNEEMTVFPSFLDLAKDPGLLMLAADAAKLLDIDVRSIIKRITLANGILPAYVFMGDKRSNAYLILASAVKWLRDNIAARKAIRYLGVGSGEIYNPSRSLFERIEYVQCPTATIDFRRITLPSIDAILSERVTGATPEEWRELVDRSFRSNSPLATINRQKAMRLFGEKARIIIGRDSTPFVLTSLGRSRYPICIFEAADTDEKYS